MLHNEPKPDMLNLLSQIQEATTSDIDEERGSFKKGDRVIYNMLGGGLTDSDLIRTLGADEHAIRIQHNNVVAEIVESMGDAVSRYSIRFNDGFTIADVAASELNAIAEAGRDMDSAHETPLHVKSEVNVGPKKKKNKRLNVTFTSDAEKAFLKKIEKRFHEDIIGGTILDGDAAFDGSPEVLAKVEGAIKAGLSTHKGITIESKTNEAEDATQTMKPQEKPDLNADDLHMEDYSEEDLNKPEAKIKSKSEESGDAIRGVEDKELEQTEDEVVKPKNESKVEEAVEVKDIPKTKIIAAYKKYREKGKSREEAVQRTKKDFEDVSAPEIRKILAVKGVRESNFSFLKKQKPLWLCNECFKTFRSDECICTFCRSINTENLLEGYGDLVGSTKEVFKVTWKDEETGDEKSTKIMAFDKDDAKREVERNPKKKVIKVDGPIKSAEKGNEVPFEQVLEGSRIKEDLKLVDRFIDRGVSLLPHVQDDVTKVMDQLMSAEGDKLSPEEWQTVEKELQAVVDSYVDESKLIEGIGELVGEIPGIDVEDQKILNWALEDGAIPIAWPSEEDMIDQLSMKSDTMNTSDDYRTVEDLKPIYLKHVLLPKAIEAYGKSVSESEWSDEMEQEGIPVVGKTYNIQQSVGKGWSDGNYKVTEVELSRTVRGDLGKYFKVEGNDTWWLAKFYHFEEVGVEEANKKEVKPFRTIEIVRSQVDPDVFNIRVVELPKGDMLILDTKPSSKIALKRGKELAYQLNAKFLGIVDEVKLKEASQLVMGIEIEKEHTDDPELAKKIALDHLEEDPEYYTKLKKMEAGACDEAELMEEEDETDEEKVSPRIIDRLKKFAKDHNMTLAELEVKLDREFKKEVDKKEVKEQEEKDFFITVGKGLSKEDAEKLAQEKDGQVIVDEEDGQKFAVITKGE